MFSNAKVGDVVWSSMYGMGVISDIRESSSYPIYAIFEKLNKFNAKFDTSYSISGTRGDSEYQTLFWQEFEIPKEAFVKPLPKLEVDTKVLVWDNDTDYKHKRYFSRFEYGKIVCFDGGATSWSEGTDTTTWNNWKLYKEE